jgi:hypothetical protein
MVFTSTPEKEEVLMCVLESRNFQVYAQTRTRHNKQFYPYLVWRTRKTPGFRDYPNGVLGASTEGGFQVKRKRQIVFSADFLIYALSGTLIFKEE